MNLLVRTEVSARIGLGHVMRCLALAQAWQDRKGRVIFLMGPSTPLLEGRLRSEGIETRVLLAKPGSAEDANETEGIAKEINAEWIVMDGFCFASDFQRRLKDSGLRVCLLDDHGRSDVCYADIILNADLCADKKLYPRRFPSAKLLLGTQYLLFRREFSKWITQQMSIAPIGKKILITMGGSDPDNVTLKVVRALQRMKTKGTEVVAVVGAGNPHQEALQLAVQRANVPVELAHNVTDMPRVMAWCDVAISAGGGTCWELLLMGKPTYALVLSEDQHENARLLERAGAIINGGWHNKISEGELAKQIGSLCENSEKRNEISQLGRALVDEKGAMRVVDCLLSFS